LLPFHLVSPQSFCEVVAALDHEGLGILVVGVKFTEEFNKQTLVGVDSDEVEEVDEEHLIFLVIKTKLFVFEFKFESVETLHGLHDVYECFLFVARLLQVEVE
jgi:hypothetical protein